VSAQGDKQRERERRLRREAHARGQDYAAYLAAKVRRLKVFKAQP
jgi:hypothetical protein